MFLILAREFLIGEVMKTETEKKGRGWARGKQMTDWGKHSHVTHGSF